MSEFLWIKDTLLYWFHICGILDRMDSKYLPEPKGEQ